MNLINLKSAVAQLGTWKSIVLARVAGANIKVMPMDGAPYPDESHDHPERLLVVDGQLNLTVGSEAITVRAERYMSSQSGSRTLSLSAVQAPWSFLTHEV
jgi:quercetin dioxygenase-like cupin family protein